MWWGQLYLGMIFCTYVSIEGRDKGGSSKGQIANRYAGGSYERKECGSRVEK